ncbi:MAG: CRISPR-associated endonuclease Cas1 [Candidatus Tectomicrobia bacterium]
MRCGCVLPGVATIQRRGPGTLGIEGAAAREYFAHFAYMFKPGDDAEAPAFEFASRNRRPPRDPVNALLSFLYAILTKEMVVTLIGVGFDPYLGFWCSPANTLKKEKRPNFRSVWRA